MEDLLLQAYPLFFGECEKVCHRVCALLVLRPREVFALGVTQRTLERLELTLRLLDGTSQTVERFAGFGFGTVHKGIVVR